ncbi:unnamed protein product [Toxocara canis]|uniref:FLYWCH-type domain-containing protein n=1 Tax=Toxocara canis TaxID=6265 RepID=A0A183V2V6_TOXCA|nr:unnamed protein product [Toxocara canis]
MKTSYFSYNHVLLFLTREELDQYAAYNNWIKLGEKNRKSKGGLAIYYRCSMEKQNRGRCQHKMMAIKRPEGCFVAKTTDGGEPHKHKLPSSAADRRSLQFSCTPPKCTYRRRSWLDDLFEGVPRDLLKKVKWMRDRQKGDKMIDLEKIASDLFAQMDCRHQSELLSLCC